MDQTAGFLIPVAGITMMLWLLWSDSLRKRPMPRLWYGFRAFLYVLMAGVLAWNGWRYAYAFRAWNFFLIGTAVAVALLGAVYFGRKAVRGESRE